MRSRRFLFVLVVLIFAVVPFQGLFSEDAIQYETLDTEKASCNIGMLYRQTENGMDIEISALATGKGADFRAWKIKDIKLNIDGSRTRPDSQENFYITKESFFRGPATVVFAVIGIQYEQYAERLKSSGTAPATMKHSEAGPIGKSIDKAGMATGLGFMASQAAGDITGLTCTFHLDNKIAESIDGNDTVEIVFMNEDKHIRERARIPIKIITSSKRHIAEPGISADRSEQEK